MKKTLLVVLLDEFADWEAAYPMAVFNMQDDPDNAYQVRTVGLTRDPVRSLGGLTVTPDLALDEVGEDYAGLVLVGGNAWEKSNPRVLLPLIERTLRAGKPLGAICAATMFLARHGFLNDVQHTSNGSDYLAYMLDSERASDSHYTNQAGYLDEKTVSNGGIITAPGVAPLQFTRALMYALERDTPEYIEKWYAAFH